MNQLQLINFARGLAHQPALHSNDSEYINFLPIYKVHLGNLIKSRPWLFAHEIVGITTADETNDGVDLGYTYKYRITNTDIKDVLSININDSYKFSNIIPNTRQALRLGISYIPSEDGPVTGVNTNFVFVNNILHSDSVITSAIVKKNIEGDAIQSTPDSFQLYLAYTLAEIVARIVGQDSRLADGLKDMVDDMANQAIRDEQSNINNPHLETLYNWIQTYYVNALSFQNNSRRNS